MTEMSSAESHAFVDAIDRAFKRVVREARLESIRTGTPFYVWQDGKVVDLNAAEHRAADPPAPYAAESDE
jgi:hypothetical protein